MTATNPLDTLRPTRKADRPKMAALIADAMRAAGATVTVEPCGWEPRRLSVAITAPGGAYCSVAIDGTRRNDYWLATWNTPRGVYLDMYGMNPFHYSKCNRGAPLRPDLLAVLADDLRAFANGSGYMAAGDPRLIAMREHYEREGWPWHGPTLAATPDTPSPTPTTPKE